MDEMDAMFGDDEQSDSENSNHVSSIIRSTTSGVLQFHSGTEEALYLFVKQNASQGDYDAVLKAIDIFCYTRHWMMHIGDKKLTYLFNAIEKMKELNTHDNRVVVELGSYCGYSAISIASRLDKNNGDILYCVESEAQCVHWTQRMVDYAGFTDYVKILQHRASDSTAWCSELPSSQRIDLLFIDHDKREYLDDLLRIEALGLLQTDSVVVADNVLCFNAPLTEYLDHVRDATANGKYRESQLYLDCIEYATSDEERGNVDGIEVSIYK